jgi:hypothetical protein
MLHLSLLNLKWFSRDEWDGQDTRTCRTQGETNERNLTQFWLEKPHEQRSHDNGDVMSKDNQPIALTWTN